MMLYQLHEVSHRYRVGRESVAALRGVTLEVSKGEFLAVAGPSGSGKTTLLNLLGLIERADEGTVCFETRDVAHLDERARTHIRRDRIGYIFQAFNLIPVLTAFENVEYALLRRGHHASVVHDQVRQALEAVAMSPQAHQRPNEMSGGQRQRVAIARALVRDPHVILADEPTAALDQRTGAAVLDLMKKLNRERGTTFIFSSHDPRVLAAADRVMRLEDGRVQP
jgi:putative ABC transport system ATP-binding protein